MPSSELPSTLPTKTPPTGKDISESDLIDILVGVLVPVTCLVAGWVFFSCVQRRSKWKRRQKAEMKAGQQWNVRVNETLHIADPPAKSIRSWDHNSNCDIELAGP